MQTAKQRWNGTALFWAGFFGLKDSHLQALGCETVGEPVFEIENVPPFFSENRQFKGEDQIDTALTELVKKFKAGEIPEGAMFKSKGGDRFCIETSLFTPFAEPAHRAYVYEQVKDKWTMVGGLITTGSSRAGFFMKTGEFTKDDGLSIKITLTDGYVETINFEHGRNGSYLETDRSRAQFGELNMAAMFRPVVSAARKGAGLASQGVDSGHAKETVVDVPSADASTIVAH